MGFVSSTAIQKTMKQRKAEVNAIRKARRRMEENIGKKPPFCFSVSMDREREFYAQKREGGEKPRLPSGRVYVEKIRKIAEITTARWSEPA